AVQGFSFGRLLRDQLGQPAPPARTTRRISEGRTLAYYFPSPHFIIIVQNGSKTETKADIKLAYKHAFVPVFVSYVLNSYNLAYPGPAVNGIQRLLFFYQIYCFL